MTLLHVAVFQLLAWSADPVVADARLVSGTALTRLIDQADVPAETSGTLQTLHVREGLRVKAGDLLAELSVTDAELALERATLELESAENLAASEVRITLARLALEESEADLERANAELEAARRKAESELALRGARLAAPVAEADLQRALAARRDARDSVSQAELDQLKLAFERAKLDVQQAEQDREVAVILVRAKTQEVRSLTSAVSRRRAEQEQAVEDRETAVIARRLKTNGVAAAKRELERRRLRSPLAGVVVSTHRRQGEWVDSGERVLRIVSLDRLRVETFFKAEEARRIREGLRARFEPGEAGRGGKEYRGVVTFVGTEIDPVNGQVLVWAEIENPGPRHPLKPGIRGVLTIDPAEREPSPAEAP